MYGVVMQSYLESLRHRGNIENIAAWYLQNFPRRTKGRKSASLRERSRRRKNRR